MKYRPLLISLVLCLPLVACKTVSTNTPPAVLAPGYSSQFDQTTGQTLAALNAFVSKATLDYQKLTPSQQVSEKVILNNFVLAVNTANQLYLAFHAGGATQGQVALAMDKATAAQNAYTQEAK